VIRAPSLSKTERRDARAASSIRAGVAMMVWPLREGTVGPNIGWRPTTDARDASIAATGLVFSEVRSQRICSFERKGAIS